MIVRHGAGFVIFLVRFGEVCECGFYANQSNSVSADDNSHENVLAKVGVGEGEGRGRRRVRQLS